MRIGGLSCYKKAKVQWAAGAPSCFPLRVAGNEARSGEGLRSSPSPSELWGNPQAPFGSSAKGRTFVRSSKSRQCPRAMPRNCGLGTLPPLRCPPAAAGRYIVRARHQVRGISCSTIKGRPPRPVGRTWTTLPRGAENIPPHPVLQRDASGRGRDLGYIGNRK